MNRLLCNKELYGEIEDTLLRELTIGYSFTEIENGEQPFSIKGKIRNCANYCIVVRSQDTPYRSLFPNNVVVYDGNADKLLSEVKYVFTGFGREKSVNNIFVIGDPHFQHKNIIKYCRRPWNSGIIDGEVVVEDKDVTAMNEALIENWNKTVSADDTVIVNGDFCLGDRKNIPNILARLNGHKQLIMGNHDRFAIKNREKYRNLVDFYTQSGFEFVSPYPIIVNKFIMISHEPLEWIDDNGVYLSVYAHVHNSEMYRDYTPRTFCSSAERIGYTPIRLSRIIEICEKAEKNGDM